jgi:hypothetical protein
MPDPQPATADDMALLIRKHEQYTKNWGSNIWHANYMREKRRNSGIPPKRAPKTLAQKSHELTETELDILRIEAEVQAETEAGFQRNPPMPPPSDALFSTTPKTLDPKDIVMLAFIPSEPNEAEDPAQWIYWKNTNLPSLIHHLGPDFQRPYVKPTETSDTPTEARTLPTSDYDPNPLPDSIANPIDPSKSEPIE